jgi:hypothetical protein
VIHPTERRTLDQFNVGLSLIFYDLLQPVDFSYQLALRRLTPGGVFAFPKHTTLAAHRWMKWAGLDGFHKRYYRTL